MIGTRRYNITKQHDITKYKWESWQNRIFLSEAVIRMGLEPSFSLTKINKETNLKNRQNMTKS